MAGVEAAYREFFVGEPTRASVTFLGVERLDVLRFDTPEGVWVYATVGMSRRPMTGASDTVLRADGPHAELVMRVRADAARFGDLWRQLAVIAAAPAVEGVVYGVGQTVDLQTPLAAGSRCTGGVVAPSGYSAVAVADVVTEIMQVIPATATELAWCRVHGADRLLERWTAAGTDLLDLGRDPVPLQ